MTITETAQRATLRGHGTEMFVYLGHGKAARESGPIVRAAKREHGSGYALVNVETGEEVRGAGGGSATKFWAAPVPTVEIEVETTATEDEAEVEICEGCDRPDAECECCADCNETECVCGRCQECGEDEGDCTCEDEDEDESPEAIVEPRADCTDDDCARAAREGHTLEEAERAMVTTLIVEDETYHLARDPLRTHIMRAASSATLCGYVAQRREKLSGLALVDCLVCLDRYTEETRPKACATY